MTKVSSFVPVEELELSTRLRNTFYYEDIKYVGEARIMSDAEWLRVPNMGKKTLGELRELVGPSQKPSRMFRELLDMRREQARLQRQMLATQALWKAATALAKEEKERVEVWRKVADERSSMVRFSSPKRLTPYETAFAVARQTWNGPFFLQASGRWIATPEDYAIELDRLNLRVTQQPNWGLEWIDLYQVAGHA